MWVGGMVAEKTITPDWSWKLMFLIGALPAFLCVFLQVRLKEPEKWVKAREAGRLTGAKFGSYMSLFGDVRWRGPALWGMVLSISGVIGLWGIGFFAPELVGPVIENSLRAQNLPVEEIAGAKRTWVGINSIVQNVGAFLGMLGMSVLAQRIGRKPAFVIAFIAALLATVGFFQLFNGKGDIWMSGVMGACQLALFAGFAIYLPELFPTRLRSTGTSFCYNVGRFVAAFGILQTASIKAWANAGAVTAVEKIDAFRNAATYMSAIFLLGLVALIFLPETKGRPMPEDVEAVA
jgi:MFS family permease